MAAIRNLSLLPRTAKDIAATIHETEITDLSVSEVKKEYQIAGMKMNIIDIKFMHKQKDGPLAGHNIDDPKK